MQPTVWGKHLWKSIHYIALGYPSRPSDDDKEAYRTFFHNLWRVIPCYKCANNYKEHLVELPIEPFLDTTDRLFEWTVLLHNIVNRDTGKRSYSLQEAYKLYSSCSSDNNKVEKESKMWMLSTLILLVLLMIVVGLQVMKSRKLT